MSVGQVGHIKLDSEVWCKRLQPKQLRDLVGISIHFIPAGLPGKLKVLCWLWSYMVIILANPYTYPQVRTIDYQYSLLTVRQSYQTPRYDPWTYPCRSASWLSTPENCFCLALIGRTYSILLNKCENTKFYNKCEE